MIVVLATIELHPGQREAFLHEFRQIVPKVLAETGCIEYFPAVDVSSGIAAQASPRDDVVVVVEKWESVPALEAHLIAPHMMEYRLKVKPLVQGTSLQILEPAQ
jgi:quinol monooxygenase YgiN